MTSSGMLSNGSCHERGIETRTYLVTRDAELLEISKVGEHYPP